MGLPNSSLKFGYNLYLQINIFSPQHLSLISRITAIPNRHQFLVNESSCFGIMFKTGQDGFDHVNTVIIRIIMETAT
ncbi:hypothetical protein BCIN_15g00910 [Botrytis cinerea B05.10]|uniref:Uncharacterized protein n=1 Tax=Botryotinia fuckeliana (strain B05.10) TaxID=332648 RepID=A0A384K3V8_BOTFB|nr:hypothetical protein BCIN_15g00910 [Botrytis cinerea B05.10]ATZ57516.1 hypothetical protein BCIN_15g00910 [Botrytis cinerea B05.10]